MTVGQAIMESLYNILPAVSVTLVFSMFVWVLMIIMPFIRGHPIQHTTNRKSPIERAHESYLDHGNELKLEQDLEQALLKEQE